jgi:hypothetical protein
MTKSLRKRMAVTCSEVEVKAAACSSTEDEAVECSEARI